MVQLKPNLNLITTYRLVHYLRSRMLIPNYNQNLSNSESKSKSNQQKSNASSSKSISCSILENNGFITSETGAGLITYLPLGKRVLNKLTELIRSEMNTIQGQEIEMPSLSNLSLWTTSGRDELMGNELFRLKDRHQKDHCLCPTHEEVVTSLVSKYSKDISSQCLGNLKSLRLYQITRKYRDESRPKHGLLRTREFLMKDMYSFHTSESCVEETYEQVCKAYETIFDRLELNYKKAVASTGSMGGSKSHEYHIESEIGEDKIFECKICSKSISSDLVDSNKPVKQSDLCSKLRCSNQGIDEKSPILKEKRCIEIGHTFILGDRYTKCFPINLNEKQNITMGCYGIGVSRLMQACVEAHHENSHYPNWPVEIAPFKICIIPAKEGSKEYEKSEKMVKYLSEMLNKQFHDDVLIDDRNKLTIGTRIIDAKLMGIPYLVILGKCIHDEQVEILINSVSLEKALKNKKFNCHSRETAHYLKQLNNDYLYMRKQNKFANYFN
jgi:prolyl-tRNA synthetase